MTWLGLIIRGTWDLVLALAAAMAAALWLEPHTLENVTTELVAFFTIQAAVILPAMIFTAGILRGDGLSLAEVDSYQGALRRQMTFWVTLLALDFVSVAIIIIGKASEWTWVVTIGLRQFHLGWLLTSAATLCGTLAILRMVPFVRGVMSLLELNGLMARKVAEAREVRPSPALSESGVPDFKPPDGFGRIVRTPSAPRPRRRSGG
jgi:hypothetical protein